MLKEIDLEIISYLFNYKERKIENVVSALNYKTEEIRMSINRINLLFNNSIYLWEDNNISLIDKHVETIYQNENITMDLLLYYLSIENRRMVIILYLLTNGEYISLSNLAGLVDVSKNTVLNDLNFIKKQLKKYKARVNYSRKYGYTVEGDESSLRRLINKGVTIVLSTPIGKYLLSYYDIIDLNEKSILKKKLENIEKRLSFIFSDETFEILPYSLLLIIERIQNFNINYNFKSQFREIKETKEFITISSLFWNYEFLNEKDLEYLVLLILSSNKVKNGNSIELSSTQLQQVENSVDNFIIALEKKLALKFKDKNKLKKSLVQHLVPAIYRNLLGIQVMNPLANQFHEEHHTVNLIIKSEMKHFNNFIDHDFSKDEIAFISMIVMSNILVDDKIIKPKTFSGVVICQSGTSVSKLLTEQLKVLLPNIEFSDVMSVREFEQNGSNNDFIFSTVPIAGKENVFLIPSFMSQKEKDDLKSKVYSRINKDNHKKTRFVLSHISEYLKDDVEEQVAQKLHQFFEYDEINESPSQFLHSTHQISTITDMNLVWEELVDKSFQELLKRGSVTRNYIQVCKNIFYKSYDSHLISPGVLIPHAPTDEGVIVPDVQVNLFKNPYVGPNNKKYSIIIALAPGENNEHISWLIDLNNKLLDEEFRKNILDYKNKENLLNLLQEN